MRSHLKDLIHELRNRSVFRAMAAYAVAAWILLQIADVTFDRLPIPANSMTVLIVIAIVGFPVTFVLAWAYEITLDGVVRHDETKDGGPRLAFLPFILVLVVFALAGSALLYHWSQEYWEPPRRSVAVLPFINYSNEPDTDYFSDGLTEEIRSLIVRLNEFRVVALSSSYGLRNTVLDVVSIANRLGADVVLQGSVRRYGKQVSVTARLIDGGDGNELWSDNYNRELSDLVTIQKDIARQVARALHVVLPVVAERRLENLGTKNVEAYDLYLRGLDYLRRPADQVTLAQAQGFLRQSIALDPEFTNAHAAICEVHLSRYTFSRDAGQFGEAERACRAALEFDNSSSDVHVALGGLYRESGKYENALHEYELAIEDNGDSADAYIGLAETYVALERSEDAETSLRRAIEIDVSYWASFNAMGAFLFDNGRYLEAAEFFQMFVSRADDDAQAMNNLGGAYYLAGDFSRAAKAWNESLAIKPTRSAYSNTGTMYFYLGEFQKAADRYARAVNLAPLDYRLWGNLADAYYYTDNLKQVADVAYKRAIEFGEKRLEVNASDMDTTSDVAYYYSRVGKIQKSRDMNASARSAAPDNMYVQYNGALIHTHLGETAEALAALKRAVALGYQKELLLIDPGFSGLVAEEGFKNLVSPDKQ
jgi:TolB-like protein/Tfp pilus assembly protein PilF